MTPRALRWIATLFAAEVVGLTFGPGLWHLVAHGDARLLAPAPMLRIGTVALFVAGVFFAWGAALRWLTRGRQAGMLGASVLLFLPLMLIAKYHRFREWVAAAVPPDLADAPLQDPAMLAGAVGAIVVMVVRHRREAARPLAEREAEVAALYPTYALHPGLAPGYQVLVYDGDCAFCAWSVNFILARDDRHTLFLAPRNSAFGRALDERHPELRTVSSVIWVSGIDDAFGERVYTRWEAIEHMGTYLGGGWQQLTRFTGALIPVRILDAGYAVIASVRHRLVPSTACRVPTPDDRRRLLA